MAMKNFPYSNHLIHASRIIFLASLVAACGPDDYGETSPGTKKITPTSVSTEDGLLRTVPFITLRNKTGSSDAAEYFGDERNAVHAGYCDLSRTPLEALESIAEKAPFYIPDDIVKIDKVRELSMEEFWRDLEGTMDGRRPVLYTHGYYISFERGCKRASLFNDTPLALSRQLHGYPRLGETGSHLEKLTGVDIIDVSEIPVRYPSGHLYHLYQDIVAGDLIQLLNDGKPASQRSNLKRTSENYWMLQPRAVDRAGGSG